LLEAFGVSKSFHRQNKYSWYSNVNNLLQFLDIDIKMLEKNKSELKRHIYRKLKLKYDTYDRSNKGSLVINKTFPMSNTHYI
jgi:hypothetical protein